MSQLPHESGNPKTGGLFNMLEKLEGSLLCVVSPSRLRCQAGTVLVILRLANRRISIEPGQRRKLSSSSYLY